jgi:DNA invertase Pin-like site-specific DNA recombinase
MKIGYGRVSTLDQCLDSQTDALAAAGCQEVYLEKASGKNTDRPELQRCLEYLRSGDTLVILKLDRLGRSIRDLIDISIKLEQRGITLQSITEGLDGSTPGGKLMFHMFAALAEFERDLIRERTNKGLAAARARGRLGGRKPKLSKMQVDSVVAMSKNRNYTVSEIIQSFGISETTYRRILKNAETMV